MRSRIVWNESAISLARSACAAETASAYSTCALGISGLHKVTIKVILTFAHITLKMCWASSAKYYRYPADFTAQANSATLSNVVNHVTSSHQASGTP
jgi:hypothetical protein